MRVALVSCVKSRRPEPAPARDLYTSPLFRAMRRYAESHADAWYILSAKHGLVDRRTHGFSVTIPLEGLTLGRQLQRLGENRLIGAHTQAQIAESHSAIRVSARKR